MPVNWTLSIPQALMWSVSVTPGRPGALPWLDAGVPNALPFASKALIVAIPELSVMVTQILQVRGPILISVG
ncbi:MAG: hypothetical protein HYU33_03540 [Candidatus Omnitrophica bacterium]|nr:hypothetical protein [Candidatus Omnitrophota bacterium]